MVLLAGREAITVCSSLPHKLAYPTLLSPSHPFLSSSFCSLSSKTCSHWGDGQEDIWPVLHCPDRPSWPQATPATTPGLHQHTGKRTIISSGEGILYEMDHSASVCSLVASDQLPLAIGKRKGGPGAHSHRSMIIYVTWYLLFHSCRSTKECMSTPPSSVSHS